MEAITYNSHLAMVLCGCKTWFVALREEHKLRVFENIVLRRILRPKGDEGGNCITRS
jgi:hypothetical protein